MQISPRIRALGEKAEEALREPFAAFDRAAAKHTEHVLDVFRAHRVSESMFSPSTGYGYGDAGRDAADLVLRDVFRAESGFVRTQIISGTHALTIGLFALLRPGDTLLSVTGAPYDTLLDVIGNGSSADTGSLKDFGVRYEEIPLGPDGVIDLPAVLARLREPSSRVKVVFIQRSKGYFARKTLSSEEIGAVVKEVKSVSPDTYVFVDNCYGEFTDEFEPVYYGADLMAGSLIKNPGGGMADTGGYLCGSSRATALAANRLSSPGVALEAGASLGQTRNILKGLFYAPHTVAQALKTAAFAAWIFESLGYEVAPKPLEARHDIIQTV
ncbi:MAG: methionine gamma-lyase family protein, partial [Clostridia bacterium]|nr:methionine gamma-lyase family protein [Clostridia bacterium]